MSFLVSIFKPLAYISLPLILVQRIANSSTFGRYYARVAVYVGTLIVVSSCSIVAAAGMTLIGRSNDVNNLVARVFYAIVSRALDLKIEIEGEEILSSTRPAVLMANHQSMLDIFILGRLMPKQTAIMSKKSLQFTPLGPFMTMSGTIFIDRGNNARAVRSVEAAGEKMKATKTSLWMFPEGTRHSAQEPSMLPLKKGGFHLAINAGIPIVPIVTENYWWLYRKGVFESGVIKVRVLPPVLTADLTAGDVGMLSTRVRDQMLEALRDISHKVPSSSSGSESKSGKDDSAKVEQQPFTTSTTATSTNPSGPLEPAVPDVGAMPDLLDVEAKLGPKKGSSSSIASSAASSSVNDSSSKRKASSSENGTETEEDEGMILVGRPNQ